MSTNKLTAEQVREAIFNGSSYASYDGVKYYADGIGMQAIADELNAKLGDAYTREECEAAFVHGYSLGSLPVGSNPQWDENRQTVDEHMAELGWVRERTCEIEVRESAWGGYTRHCGNCGADFDCDTRNRQNYCPNCGARVTKSDQDL
ncbi:MAG: hypothetical protein IKB96_04415 [Prevotella sp.]|nr:hypothetical protein [Prevotella sp.]MBR3223764.1 hypothetical protein [Atopobiaceae bacterium]